ncbi:hypothetical protein [Palaeococcus ferrophilus]|uniref:hypothetical protein n=1 Tax=Palaeococcus ferrophilus TaxID=83868 RepID=UPI00064F6597|nr:hypothetical protein [Palaeococcus ferrophilus]
MAWSWKEYYEKKKALEAKLKSLNPGQSGYWQTMRELQELERQANAQRYSEGMKRNETQLKRYGDAYKVVYERNKALYEKQWGKAVTVAKPREIEKNTGIKTVPKPAPKPIPKPIGMPNPNIPKPILKPQPDVVVKPKPMPKPEVEKKPVPKTVQATSTKQEIDVKKLILYGAGLYLLIRVLRG